MTTAKSEDTKRRLVQAAIDTISSEGIAKVSARTIAERAGLAQGLVFYHFGTVSDLIGEACLEATRARVDRYAARFDAVDDLTGLVDLADDLHREERAAGTVAVLGQILAAAQADPALAVAAGDALALWTARVSDVLRRVLAGSPFGDILAPDALAELVAAAFVGIELTEPTRGDDGLDRALGSIRRLTSAMDDLGPVARRAVRSALK
ncbi:TetR/AcrR family transcriptional regulator [Aeromicrobium phragmitis]|uniref:TetR/AcrR family transcriptional regulator n=1 Tax=Aeromicrobium phragmitis TaxID=2478914 RepID=A0A3L8PHK8_9ACTN|nr:TetR/AcrR family transcriptional regulator [Aeromicrobium phragmitis]RLV54661.1 TetR/AcrR family transcriptional regulator [Aeromicrobium phragmitis]